MKMPGRIFLAVAAATATAAISFYFFRGGLLERSSNGLPQREASAVRIGSAPASDFRPAADSLLAGLPARNASPSAGSTTGAEDVGALEAQWHASRETQARIELAGKIAAENDADAVRAIGRLLKIERHPDVERALLSSLVEIDPTIAVEERLVVIQTMLRSASPQLRAIALAALDPLDDPRVAPLLVRLSREDLDSTVRVVAAKMMRARAETEAALAGERGRKGPGISGAREKR
jgi:hypothetical protein